MMAVIGFMTAETAYPPSVILNAPITYLTLLMRQLLIRKGISVGPSLEVMNLMQWMEQHNAAPGSDALRDYLRTQHGS